MALTYGVRLTHKDGASEVILGRVGWALARLWEAGARGISKLEGNTAIHWGHYVHQLRHKHGLAIETVMEDHAGPFAGSHARYYLRAELNAVVELTPDELRAHHATRKKRKPTVATEGLSGFIREALQAGQEHNNHILLPHHPQEADGGADAED